MGIHSIPAGTVIPDEVAFPPAKILIPVILRVSDRNAITKTVVKQIRRIPRKLLELRSVSGIDRLLDL